jgi:hypothetical protein
MPTNTIISSFTLKRRLRQRPECPEDIWIRVDRSISWLQCAENNSRYCGHHHTQLRKELAKITFPVVKE